MRILLLEMKRVIKSRMTWILLAVAVAVSALISWQVVSEAQYRYADESGELVKISGTAAIHARKELMQPYEGPVTEEKLRNALQIFQSIYKKYGGGDGENIPQNVYYGKVVPIEPFLDMIYSVYPKSGSYYEALSKVSPNEISGFYQDRSQALRSQMEAKYPENQNVLREVQKLNEKVRTPFKLIEGYTNDNSTNLCILIFLLVFIGTTIASPVFSAEYQNGSDDILRCTKNGHTKFAVAKLCSALLILLAMFAVCMLTFVLVVNNAYGWDSLQTSVQMMFPLSFVPFTVGREQGLTILAGLLTLLAAACFVLFASAKCRHSTSALIIAVAFCIFPAILHTVWHGNIADFVTCVLPTGGAGISHNFFSQLNQAAFITFGPFSVWAPRLTMAAALVEIPLFFILAVRAYCKHQVA